MPAEVKKEIQLEIAHVLFIDIVGYSKLSINEQLTNMALGDKAAALALVERAMTANPIEKDAITGPASIEILARVAAQIDEPDRAIAALQKLLSIPYAGVVRNIPLTSALLRLDPMFDPLRNDPRFQKLVASPAPKDR
jgi:serine/threonine-protein kinase